MIFELNSLVFFSSDKNVTLVVIKFICSWWFRSVCSCTS